MGVGKEQYEYLMERDLINNFKLVFGIDYPFFAKLLYKYFSHGYSKSKITLSRII